MKHSYWIPTNRDVARSLGSYIKEVDHCQRKFNKAIPIFVLDSGDERCELWNKEAVERINKNYPDVLVYHIPFAKQIFVVSKIIEKTGFASDNLADCFVPRTVNYGAAMNKIFLFAAALGFDVIHRRDSDTVLQDECPYPLELEINNIGKTVSDSGNDKPISIVGSGYVGEWNLDIKDFVKDNDELFRIFLDKLCIQPELHKVFMDEMSEDCKRYYAKDDLRLDTKLPEAGNFCAYKIFEYFPCLPADFTLGSDYFLFKMAISFKFPILFHERRVFHIYHEERRSPENMLRYAKSLMKFCDHSPMYWFFVNYVTDRLMLEMELDGISADDLHSKWMLDHMSDGLISLNDIILVKRRKNMNEMAADFISTQYPNEAQGVLTEIDDIFEECKEDYLRHAILMKAWRKIITVAKNDKITEEMFYER